MQTEDSGAWPQAKACDDFVILAVHVRQSPTFASHRKLFHDSRLLICILSASSIIDTEVDVDSWWRLDMHCVLCGCWCRQPRRASARADGQSRRKIMRRRVDKLLRYTQYALHFYKLSCLALHPALGSEQEAR